MKFLLLLPLVSFASAAYFEETCRQIKIKDQYLSATCRTTSGNELCTELDLSECIRNYNGDLIYVNDLDANDQGFPYIDERSEFSRTGCQGCVSSATPWILHCANCPTGRSTEDHPSEIDLGEFIDNTDGWLTCFRTLGEVKENSYCRERNIDE